ncbi:cupin domain-containing protein [Prevotella sp. 10(H)]|uniref:cupin domain-containing protein n=1 Tax=Prevotella sp. 10(H) TaxID=1158294 RepID=UPI0004A6CF7B|nr:cupin domain-containing protein [Prevotella sp. 10(H)]
MSRVIDKNSAPHYFWGDKCSSWILMNRDSLSVKIETMPAGTRETLHFHSSSRQFFFILKGTATIKVDGKTVTLKEQQGVLIEPMMRHYIANESSEAIDFLLVSQPDNDTTNDRTDLE